MEEFEKKASQLKANPNNPRTINKHDYEALKASIKKFGDLSGIVENRRTGQLVGGHMRTKSMVDLGPDSKIVITKRYDQPTSVGTVAIGYVDYNGEQYTYREVDWDLGTEQAANIAANRIQGEFDIELLSRVNYEISQLENGSDLLTLTGQTNAEIQKTLESIGVMEPKPEEPKSENIACPNCGYSADRSTFRNV